MTFQNLLEYLILEDFSKICP